MPIYFWNKDLAFIDVPKCGSTSIKLMCYQLEHGAPFGKDVASSVHKVYRSRPYFTLPHRRLREVERIAVVRDPVSRFMSGYRNKVVQEKCLDKGIVARLCAAFRLPTQPGVEEFLDRLRSYMRISPVVFKHFQSQSWFLGKDAGWYKRIFGMSQLPECAAYIRERVGGKAVLRHAMKAKGAADTAVTPALRDRILRLYKNDIAAFGQHMDGVAA